ncbi:MAG: YgiQ family radical SAM protein [Deltaproteobacteria bacterium]|nr:YgiQ family radical SAM protein [Deltaproteobacteria bacterium]
MTAHPAADLAPQGAPPLFGYPRAATRRAAPFLPMTRAELKALGWDACDVILVTGDAYVDHPSFGMAIVGRFLEAQGFRVGIIAQPDWRSKDAFEELGRPRLCFGVTGGNMDSLVNRYTSDRRLRNDDAYTPGGVSGARPDRCVIVYCQRLREAFGATPLVIGGIEASLRRIAHYDYWSEKVRRSVLLDSQADLLLYGNAERALAEVAHRLARGEAPRDIQDVRGTALLRRVPAGYIEVDSTHLDTPGPLNPPEDPYRMEGMSGASAGAGAEASAGAGAEAGASACEGASGGSAQVGARAGESVEGTLAAIAALEADDPLGARRRRDEAQRAAPAAPRVVRFVRDVPRADRARSVIRLPSFEQVREDPVLYAHASRILHQEANPGNARALVQRHGDHDLWVNPPPIPLSTEELDAVYELPFARRPHPSYGGAKIPAYEMIRFSISIQRGCFGGCTFCSITEHEGRVIQSRSEGSILREIEVVRDTVPGFTGVISDLGGPTANMWRVACKSRQIEAACRRPSCVYPGICPNLNTDHTPLIKLYRKARALPGIKKVLIASGVRYDLAVESPEYVRELAQHHTGGYLKIAPEALSEGPLSMMMKPGMGSYDRFKELFDRFSAEAGKQQYLIPYFIAAHPGTRDEDMLELALWLKANGFRADQVQAFLPSPMSTATAMYHSGVNPLQKVTRESEEVHIPKGLRVRALHKAFLRYHDPANWPILREALRRMGREDLIGGGPRHLVPAFQPVGGGAPAGQGQGRGQGQGQGPRPFRTQHARSEAQDARRGGRGRGR